MAWNYSDYEQKPTLQERYDTLLLFRQELSDAVTHEASGQMSSIAANNIRQLHESTEKTKEKYERQLATQTGQGKRPLAVSCRVVR